MNTIQISSLSNKREEKKSLTDRLVKDLENLREQLDQFYQRRQGSWNEQEKDLMIEVRKRLTQVIFLFKKVVALDQKSDDEFSNIVFSIKFQQQNPTRKLEHHKYNDEIELYTEMIYYMAFRLISILGKFPGFTNIKRKVSGITIVRNQLIEHSDLKKSEITINSFGLGGNNGPVLKAARYEHQSRKHQDKGLYVNIQEFVNQSQRLLSA